MYSNKKFLRVLKLIWSETPPFLQPWRGGGAYEYIIVQTNEEKDDFDTTYKGFPKDIPKPKSYVKVIA